MLNTVNTYLQKWLKHKKHSSFSSGLCCLAIHAHEIVLAYATRQGGKVELEYCKTIALAHNKELGRVLSDAVTSFHLDGVRCIWLLDPKHYQLILQEDLPVEPTEFQLAIRWKIKNLLTFPVEDAVIDSYPLPTQKIFNPQKMITVVVAQQSYLQDRVEAIKQSGLELTDIDIQELALRNITSAYENDEVSSALIYLSKNASQLIISRQKELYSSRKIDFDMLKTDPNDIQQGVERLALEIQRSFDYYQSKWRVSPPSRILLAMGDTTQTKIVEVLSTHLAIPVKMLDLNEIMINKAGLSMEQQHTLLPLMGELLREEKVGYVTAG